MADIDQRRNDSPPTRMRGRGCRTATIVLAATLVIGAVLVGVAVWAVLYRPLVDVAPGFPAQVEVPQGATTAEIGERLAAVGVVPSAAMFRLQSRLADADGQLRAGVYDLETGMAYDAVLDVLREGPAVRYVTVTFPEGFVIEQIAERLQTETDIPAETFTALANHGGTEEFPDHPYLAQGFEGSLEGYLFPKTYRIREGSTARDVIELMLDQFDTEIASVDLTRATALGLDLHDVVTIASMVEREAKVASERALVSSVIYNRLARGMRLEIDATIEYVLPGNRFRLRNSDLQIDSPYNTYRNGGLPPGPIANPGLASFQAAAAPADTTYLYYVLTDPNGSHTFASTTEEFLEAKRRSKEVFGR